MARTYIDILTLTRRAASAITDGRFVTIAGTQAGADAQVLGVAMSDAAAGEDFPVLALGTVQMTAGAAIAAGDAVISDADGLPVPKGSGANVIGVALNDAQPGEPVTILIR